MIAFHRQGGLILLRPESNRLVETINLKTRIRKTMGTKSYGYINNPTTRIFDLNLDMLCNNDHIKLRAFIRWIGANWFNFVTETGKMYQVRLTNHAIDYELVRVDYWRTTLELETLDYTYQQL
jgi:hypothetical protein